MPLEKIFIFENIGLGKFLSSRTVWVELSADPWPPLEYFIEKIRNFHFQIKTFKIYFSRNMSKADEGEIVEEEESGDEDDMGKYMFGSDDEEEKPEVKPEQKPEVKTEEQKPIQSLREVRSHM